MATTDPRSSITSLYDPSSGRQPYIGEKVILLDPNQGIPYTMDWAGNLPQGAGSIVSRDQGLAALNSLAASGLSGDINGNGYGHSPGLYGPDIKKKIDELTSMSGAFSPAIGAHFLNFNATGSDLSKENFSPAGAASYVSPEAGNVPMLNQAQLDAQNKAKGITQVNTGPAKVGTSIANEPLILGNGTTVPNTPPGTAPGTPAPTVTAPPGTPTTPQTPVPIPTTVLQPGNKGDGVKQLQAYLVSQGLLTQAQMDTGPGIYGPQTQAAVAALQAKLGVDNSSGVGYFGPKTIAALQASGGTPQIGNTPPGTQNTGTGAGTGGSGDTNPIQQVIDTYTEIYKQLGLPDIKAEYEKVIKEQAKLTDDMNAEILDVNSDPWLSQGVRDARTKRIQDKYQSKIDTQTHLATLYDSLYKEGQDQAKFLIGEVNDNRAAALVAAQKKQDAIDALSKDNQIVEVGGRELLVNKVSGKTVADLGPSKSATANSTVSLTTTDRQGLLGAGFSTAEVGQIEKDVNAYGLTKVLEGIKDPAQKAALNKVYGATQKVSRDQVAATVTQKVAYDGLKGAYTTKELEQFAKDSGQASFFSSQASDIEKYLNSPAAQTKYIDLLYGQYKSAGMTSD